jgi:hypothetical protein
LAKIFNNDLADCTYGHRFGESDRPAVWPARKTGAIVFFKAVCSMMRYKPAPFVTAVALALALSACARGAIDVTPTAAAEGQQGQPNQPAFSDFQDIPIPAGAQMVTARSLILGVRDAWVGRLVLKTGFNVAAAFNFFKQRTTEFGWQEITSVRSAISILSYTRGERVLTIQIQGRSLGGAEVDLTVSPRGGSTPGRVGGAPRAPVERLR